MLINDANEIKHFGLKGSKYFSNGMVFDTCVLFVYLLDKYVILHPEKKCILKDLSVTPRQIDCLNTLIINLNISKIIITPHILAEFLNRIRCEYKEGYKEIKKECLKDLIEFDEIQIDKNILLNHDKFIPFGNDISMILASEEHIKKFEFSSIASFDGRFIRAFFENSNNKILAFDLDTMQHFFN